MCTPKIKKVIQANRLLVFSLVEPTVFRSLTGPFFSPTVWRRGCGRYPMTGLSPRKASVFCGSGRRQTCDTSDILRRPQGLGPSGSAKLLGSLTGVTSRCYGHPHSPAASPQAASCCCSKPVLTPSASDTTRADPSSMVEPKPRV